MRCITLCPTQKVSEHADLLARIRLGLKNPLILYAPGLLELIQPKQVEGLGSAKARSGRWDGVGR